MTTLLSIEWGPVGIKALQFILSFSILVVLHELGHYLPARWFKCRVEKFYLFFNPYFSLYKKQIKDTEWGIGWIPFGGYVKIAGMIDESMDKEQMKQPAQPWEFRSKPAWQRLIIMVGGVVVNILLAIVIFIGITFVWGDEHLPPMNAKFGLYADSVAQKMGIQTGDIITSVNGKQIEDISRVAAEMVINDVQKITVYRKGDSLSLPVSEEILAKLKENRLGGFVTIQVPTIIDSVDKSAVFANGTSLKKGDQVIMLDNKPCPYFHQFKKMLENVDQNFITLKVLRNDDTVDVRCFVKEGKIGFSPRPPSKQFVTVIKKYSFFSSIPVGFSRCFETLDNYVAGVKKIFTGKEKAKNSLGSLISIGNAYSGVWDWQSFWSLTGIFSIILAFMNILPIPALDGGHALFTIIEIVTRRKPSEKFMEIAQTIGMILLMGLMVYALGLDFWRLFK